MKLQINDIIEVKFKNIQGICHYYVCISTISNKINTGLPYELIWLDKGSVQLYFRDLDFKEVNDYLNRCDNALYGIESIDICHKGDYKLVYATKYTKNYSSKSKKQSTSEDKETKQILNQMNKYHKIRKRKPKEHKNQVDELIDRFGRY